MNANRAMGNFVAYSVSKAAVVALTKSAAVHCGNKGYKIRVNAILPGVVETAMINNLIETRARRSKRARPMKACRRSNAWRMSMRLQALWPFSPLMRPHLFQAPNM